MKHKSQADITEILQEITGIKTGGRKVELEVVFPTLAQIKEMEENGK